MKHWPLMSVLRRWSSRSYRLSRYLPMALPKDLIIMEDSNNQTTSSAKASMMCYSISWVKGANCLSIDRKSSLCEQMRSTLSCS